MNLVKITLPIEAALDYRNMSFCNWLVEKEEENILRFNTKEGFLNIIFDLKYKDMIERVCYKAVNNLNN